MKSKIFMSIAALVCAGLLAGCASEGGLQAEESSTAPKAVIEGVPAVPDNETEEQKPLPPMDSVEKLGDCFIAPDPATNADMVEYYNSYDCEPGYIYFEEETFGRVALLLDKKCKLFSPYEWYQSEEYSWYQNEEYFWTATEDEEIIKVNKRTGEYEVLYALEQAEDPDVKIKRFDYSIIPNPKMNAGRTESGRVMYFVYTDGYHDYLLILDRDTDEYEILDFPERLRDFYAAGWQERMKAIDVDDEPYICDVCGYTGNYVIWENMYNEYFWYHPETGENTPLAISKNTGVALVFVESEQ